MPEETTPVTQAVTPAAEEPVQSTAADAAPQQGEPFDAERAKALIDKLRNEVKALKPFEKKAVELEALKRQQEEAEMTELQKAQKRIAELEEKTKAAERREMQRQAADKFKLPPALAELIPGDTLEAIEAKAEELAKALPQAKPPTNLSPTNPSGNTAETEAQKRERLLGGSKDIWKGGGVYWPPNAAE